MCARTVFFFFYVGPLFTKFNNIDWGGFFLFLIRHGLTMCFRQKMWHILALIINYHLCLMVVLSNKQIPHYHQNVYRVLPLTIY